MPQIKEGKLRALAVTSMNRSQALPDVPSMTEVGYPDIEGEGWFAFIVPAGTPKEITALLHREIVKAIALPEIKEKMATLGFETVGNSPDEASALFKAESVKWAKVIQQAGNQGTIMPGRSARQVDFRYWPICDIGLVEIAYRNLWNVPRTHSGLMSANFTTLAHFSVSSAMSLPNSAGDPGSTVLPRSANRALSLASARPAFIS